MRLLSSLVVLAVIYLCESGVEGFQTIGHQKWKVKTGSTMRKSQLHLPVNTMEGYGIKRFKWILTAKSASDDNSLERYGVIGDEEEVMDMNTDAEAETDDELDFALNSIVVNKETDDEEDGGDSFVMGSDSEGDYDVMTWTERRNKRRVKTATMEADLGRKLTWEERFEEDPLRSEEPTRDLEPKPNWFTNKYIAVSDVVGGEALDARADSWIAHMQWARRSALVPHIFNTEVVSAFTILSSDCMMPVGQIVGMLANDSIAVRDMLNSEPLSNKGGCSPWKIFRAEYNKKDNLTWPMAESQLFIGTIDPTKQIQYASRSEDILAYHESNEGRVSSMASLYEDDKDESTAIMLIINSKTNADAKRYMSGDPAFMEGLYSKWSLSPINVQDVDGRNHLMARTFGERSVLDQIHYMDPEDLLYEEEGLIDDNGRAMNQKALAFLASAGISYRYDRLDVESRFGGDVTHQDIEDFNRAMERAQNVRLQPVVENSETEGTSKAADSEDNSKTDKTEDEVSR